MQELVFLVHRIPYPPDKGDKIRSWNFLSHLTKNYRVHLGCFIDDPRDWEFTDKLRSLCGECCFVDLKPSMARLLSLRGLLDGRALTLPYYFNSELHHWAQRMTRRPQVTHAFIYCSAMAQYIDSDAHERLRCVADIVDVDSEKWADYARRKSPPLRWLYSREARRVRQIEIEIAADFDATIVATGAELALLKQFVVPSAGRTLCVTNGVDSNYFSPDRPYANPYDAGGPTVIFVGAMDYWPNIDAVTHFVRAIFPTVRQRLPGVRFFIVGSNPSPEVLALASGRDIVVTGRVPDVRPYLAHGSAVVAPLRIARGVQNKILEGMAMAKPVVGSSEALTGIAADIGKDVLCATSPDEFADALHHVITTDAGPAIGANARRRVLTDYAWQASLDKLDAAVGSPIVETTLPATSLPYSDADGQVAS
jgi:sugar transferase (PEP-CTERM/EpsH1 system associated)